MKIDTYVAGPIDANNYLIWDEKSKEAILIDCSDYNEGVIDKINTEKLVLKYILLTHGHFDHILGINSMLEVLNAKVGIHSYDVPMLNNTDQMCLMFGISPTGAQKYDFLIDENSNLYLGDIPVNILYTPGHSEGSVCYLIENNLFCGDTLFKGSYGRTDLPGGNFNKIHHSIKDILFNLNDDIIVYPGHGDSSTIGYEKRYNDIN